MKILLRVKEEVCKFIVSIYLNESLKYFNYLPRVKAKLNFNISYHKSQICVTRVMDIPVNKHISDG